MKITGQLTDEQILLELGARVRHQRIQAGLTQQELADAAGVSRGTVIGVEEGRIALQSASLIRVLRALGLADRLDSLIPPAEPGPMDKLAGNTGEKKRVRKPRDGAKAKKKPFKWGEDKE